MSKAVIVAIALFAAAVVGPIQAVDAALRTAPHAPIWIRSDGDFGLPVELNGVTSGDGSEAAPYVIEGWDIAPVAGFGIRIENTSAHLLIRGNTIHDGEVAPRLCLIPLGYGFTCVPPSICVPLLVCVDIPPISIGIDVYNASNITMLSNDVGGVSVGVRLSRVSSTVLRENDVHRDRTGGGPSSVLEETDEFFVELQDRAAVFGRQFQFRYPQTVGIHIESSEGVSMTNNSISGSLGLGGFGLIVRDSTASIFGNTVSNSTFPMSTSGSMVQLEENRFVVGYAIDWRTDTKLQALRNGFSHVYSVNVCGEGTTGDFIGNIFDDTQIRSSATNPDCPWDSLSVAVRNNTFLNGSSLLMWSKGEVSGNTFSGGGAWFSDTLSGAIVLKGHPVIVQSNRLFDNGIAIASDDSPSLIDSNYLSGNSYGVVSYGTTKPFVHNTNMDGNGISLFNTDAQEFSESAPPGAVPVDARWNWWGSQSGPPSSGPGRLYGAIEFEPWLESPPN